ncbi:MAG: hypothetical protein BGO55_06805 [Sphingobacteriales bacterium 50-39]|nr:hypothetical protein [Sphingobacteriales bacterium]OJW52962.1 MAG: hypothetical protein BGO55_06805 [Sphingobacteriales bacterium 50-39]
MANDLLEDLPVSKLRTLLISEIQAFIRGIESKTPVEELTRKRDYIRHVMEVLSVKENVEFEEIVGRYFHNYHQKFSPE